MGRSVAESSCWRGDDLQVLDPRAQRGVARASVEELAGQHGGAGRQGGHALGGLPETTASAGGEGNDGLASEVGGFEERVDNAGFHVPPDGEADEDGVIAI